MDCIWDTRSRLCFVLLFGNFLSSFVSVHGLNLWPLPKSVNHGSNTIHLSTNFQLSTHGSNYSDSSGILKDAFERMVNLIEADHTTNSEFPNSSVLAGVNVVVQSTDDTLNFGVDESYYLNVPAKGSPLYAQIEAKTIFGALHALETFSQLCYFNFTTKVIELHAAPWTINDLPRFPYRGLLIDTSRHYLPVPVIKSVIDSMTYSKLNVLHWHIVDDQSFPLEIPSYPNLWNGAYSYSERYTINDAIEIVRYAERKGVNVLAEIDVPGHTLSWGVGYPALWPSQTCREPLDVSNEFSFKVIDGILSDFSKVFKFKFVHLGGDEVNTSCWTTTPHIKQWLNNHHMNGSDAYRYFVLRAQNIAISHGYDIINWEETFDNFGDKLSPKTVVHNWLGSGVAERVVADGLRCIVSNQDKWYLDHIDANWQGFYTNEPLTNISNPAQQKLVLGGEVCMWGEHIDTSDIQQTIWPRAAAAAERLWTPFDRLAKDPEQVISRLNDNSMTLSDGYRYFVLRVQDIAMSYGYNIINWEETFNNFGDKLSPKTVVHNWLGERVAQKVVAIGLRCIVSNQDKWYLDHLEVSWQTFYNNEPVTNISNPDQQKLILGGEVCMWGEQIDMSNIQRTIWPRAAAAAERLWTPLEKLAKHPIEVRMRLAYFRCMLNQRGVKAAPLDIFGRYVPQDPGSCIN